VDRRTEVRVVRAVRYALSFRWANHLSQLTGYLSAIALILATLTTLHAVLSRYFLGQPTVWQTEFSIYLLMFVTFVGAAYGLRHHAHVGVDLIVERLPTRPQLVVRIVTAVLAIGVVLVVAWTSGQNWWEAVEGDFRSATAWRAPLSVVYAILPLGMVLVALQYLAFVVEGVQALLGKGPAGHTPALLAQASPELAAIKDTLTDSDDAGTRLTDPDDDAAAQLSDADGERRTPWTR
jgi:TRAP-type C4-dicarboxylate transport system permease small subunit